MCQLLALTWRVDIRKGACADVCGSLARLISLSTSYCLAPLHLLLSTRFMKKTCFLGLLVAAGCSGSSTPPNSPSAPSAATGTGSATATQQAVAKYVQAHATVFPGYESVGWGQPVVYTKGREAAIKGVVAMKAFDDALVPRNKALQEYKDAVAKHEPAAAVDAAKSRYGKANKYNDSLLVIANSFTGVNDTARLGTEIAHRYRIKNQTGALVLDSATFVVYTSGKVEQL